MKIVILNRSVFIFLLMVVLPQLGCQQDEVEGLQVCNQVLIDSGCGSLSGDYCLFGLKWGAGNNFEPTGANVAGPRLSGGLVTFSLQENAPEISNHQEQNLSTQSFTALPECSKDSIRAAFQKWSSVADIQFQELPEDSDADIRIYVADVMSGGNGFPNYSDETCQVLSGQVILDPTISEARTCDRFYLYALHEIGHALGLGHAVAGNVMSPGSGRRGVNELQPGDIEGIRQIYGL